MIGQQEVGGIVVLARGNQLAAKEVMPGLHAGGQVALVEVAQACPEPRRREDSALAIVIAQDHHPVGVVGEGDEFSRVAGSSLAMVAVVANGAVELVFGRWRMALPKNQ